MASGCKRCGSPSWLRWGWDYDGFVLICDECNKPPARKWTLGDQSAETDPTSKRFAGIEVD